MKWKCDHLYKPKPLFWKIQLLSLARLSHLINTLLHMLLTTAQLNSVHFSMLFSWLITGNTETKWMDTKTWEVLYFFPIFQYTKACTYWVIWWDENIHKMDDWGVIPAASASVFWFCKYCDAWWILKEGWILVWCICLFIYFICLVCCKLGSLKMYGQLVFLSQC